MPLISNAYVVYNMPWLASEPEDAYEDYGAVSIIGIDSDLQDALKLAKDYVDATLADGDLILIGTEKLEVGDDYKAVYYLSSSEPDDQTNVRCEWLCSYCEVGEITLRVKTKIKRFLPSSTLNCSLIASHNGFSLTLIVHFKSGLSIFR
jgi:hypothetical protein